MHRFFVSPEQVQAEEVLFSARQAHQMARVLRLRRGEGVLALDNTGACYEVELDLVTPAVARGRIRETGVATGEPAVQLTLFQGVLKADKVEYVLQKGTELGICVFALTLCHRSVPRATSQSWGAKLARWDSIVKEAAEQSGRARVPALKSPMSWEAACEDPHGLALLAYEGERDARLRDVLDSCGSPTAVSLYVGPEGGLTEDEVAFARRRGIRPVSLGRRILRAETAGLAAAAAIFYALGELG